MFATILNDDTPGWRETMYGPSFNSEEEAAEYCEDFNKKHSNSNWSARVGKPGDIKIWHGDKDISPVCPVPENNT
jgi:hypothetical protein